MPSLRYSLSGSRVPFSNGRTASDSIAAWPRPEADPEDGPESHDDGQGQYAEDGRRCEAAPAARRTYDGRMHDRRRLDLGEVIHEIPHVSGEVAGRGVAVLRILGEASLDDPAHGSGNDVIPG